MEISKNLISEVEKYYTSKIKEHGISAKGVDWNSEESQEIRFSELIKVILEKNNFSILDYGSGYGALLNFLKSIYAQFHYTGFDISEEMLIKAKQFHIKTNTIKWAQNLNDEIFDYSIASGIFNVKLKLSTTVWKKYVIKTLQDLDKRSKKGFSFNMLTAYSDLPHMKDYLYYADPCFYFDYCKRNFAKDVALLHDYGLYEFSILVKK